MNLQKFITQLPNLYENWGQVSVCPKSEHFTQIHKQLNGRTTANVMQLLNFAIECMDADEIYCQVGCFDGTSLIGGLLHHPEHIAYVIDDFSEVGHGRKGLDKLVENLSIFALEDKVVLFTQTFEEFIEDLRENPLGKIGLYFYIGADDYRHHLMGLLLIQPFLAERSLIISTTSNLEVAQQANYDLIAAYPQCKLLLDKSGDSTAWNRLQVFSWEENKAQSYQKLSLQKLQNQAGSKSITEEANAENKKVMNIENASSKEIVGKNKQTTATKMVLHVGCGPYTPQALHSFFRTDRWQEIRLDINPAVEPDIVATLTNMEVVPTESVDAVWSSHNVEHLYDYEVPIALKEFYRVLKPGGFALITLPDIQKVAEYVAQGHLEDPLYISPAGPICAIDILYGHREFIAQGNHYMAHKTGFTAHSLGQKLIVAGFLKVEIKREAFNLWAIAYKGGIEESSNNNIVDLKLGENTLIFTSCARSSEQIV